MQTKCNILLLAVVGSALLAIVAGDNFAFTFDRIESINGTGEYFNYDIDIKKQDGSDTVFIVNANIEQLIELDEEWKSEIVAFRAPTADDEYTKFMQFPRVGFCTFLKTVYKKYFYEQIKNYSNLPHYEVCPIPTAKYWVKEYPFDADNFKTLAKPGVYRIEACLMQNKVAKACFHMFGSVTTV